MWLLISALMYANTVEKLAREWIKNHLSNVEIAKIEVEETKAYKDMIMGEEPNLVMLC